MVKEALRRGKKLPPLPSKGQHEARLVDRDFLFSEVHNALFWHCDFSLGSPNVRKFEGAFIEIASLVGIPVHCCAMSHGSMEIIHSQWADLLGPADWEIMAELGREAGLKVGLRVQWAGLQAPSTWFVPVRSKPVREWLLPSKQRDPSPPVDRDKLNREIDEYIDTLR